MRVPGGAYERKFDHEKAVAWYRAGWPVVMVAKAFGVTHGAIRQAADPEYARRVRERANAARRDIVASCLCGAPLTRISVYMSVRRGRHPQCLDCALKARNARHGWKTKS